MENTALTSGQALAVNTGTSTFTTGAGTGFFYGGATDSLSGATTIKSTGNFTGTLVALTADQTTAGTVLGISAQNLTTGKAIDVSLGTLYSGTTDSVAGYSIGAVNVRAQSFTGNIFNVEAHGAGGATANLANFTSTQLAGQVLNVNATSLTTGKAVAVTIGNGGTGFYLNTGAAYTGNLVQLQVNGSDRLRIDQGGNTTLGGSLTVLGTSITGPNAALTIDTGGSAGVNALNIGGNSSAMNIGRAGTTQALLGNVTVGGNLGISGNFTQTGTGTFSTGTGAISLSGDVTVASGKTVTAGAGTTTGTAVNLSTGAGLTSGTALGINTSTSTFTTTTGAGLGITSTGAFTGTLGKLTANSTATGTILGVQANALTTGKALDVDLGASALTGNTGAVEIASTGIVTGTVASITANSATTGKLLAVSGTGLTTGVALDVATGAPTGADPAGAKAIRLALGTAGTGLYANATTGFTGNFVDFKVAGGASALTVGATGAITTAGNFSQTGATTFSTGTGAFTHNGPTTVAGANTFTVGTGLATFGGGLTISAGNFTHSGTGTFSTGTGAVTLNGALRVSTLAAGVLVANSSGNISSTAPGASGNVLTSDGANWVSTPPGLTPNPSSALLDRQVASTSTTLGTTEQTIYSFSVPGATLGTSAAVEVLVYGTLLNNSGADQTYTFRFKYGATTMFQDTRLVKSNAAARTFRLRFTVASAGTTSSQSMNGDFLLGEPSNATAGTGDFDMTAEIRAPNVFTGTAAIDSTAAQSTFFTIQSGGAQANQTVVRRFASAWLP